VSSGKPEETFRVIDRRLFNEQGELRQEVLEQQQAEQKIRSESSKAAGNTPAGQAAAPAPDTPAVLPEPPKPNRSFTQLVDFLTQNAALLLGAYPDPRTGQAMLDLDGARELIDMLEALREKSRGNSTADEEQYITDRLGRLKFTYLEMTKAAAQAMREKAGRQP
jgi:hypothetical protein